MDNKENTRTAAFDSATERFAVFSRLSNQRKVQLEETPKGVEHHAPKVWDKAINPAEKVDLYFMGAGNGGFEIPFIQKILAERGSHDGFSVSCEDPSATMKNEFDDKLKTTDVGDVVKKYESVPFEDPSHIPPKSDLSISSHSWYYVKDWQESEGKENPLLKFKDSIKSDGIGLITLNSAENDRYKLLACLGEQTSEPEASGEALVLKLDELGVKNHTDIVSSTTDVSPCFQNEMFDPTTDGKLLLSFLIRTDWDTLSEEIKEKVGTKLTEITKKNGKREMIFRDSYIWIFPEKS